jgi:hypothetical protein
MVMTGSSISVQTKTPMLKSVVFSCFSLIITGMFNAKLCLMSSARILIVLPV